MQFRFQKFRTRLFLAFLSITIISLVLALTSVGYYARGSKLTSVTIEMEEVFVDILKVLRYEHDFFYYETRNPQFFKTKESAFQLKHDSLIQVVRQKLYRLLDMPLVRLLDLDEVYVKDYIKRIIYELESYERSFLLLADLSYRRGFKDYGLIGHMRNKIHRVEQLNYGINRADMLMLRRHEKDYIIRKDELYAGKLEILCNQLIQSLRLDHQLEKVQREEVIQLLQAYLTDFNSLKKLEKQIGLSNHEGVNAQMRAHADRTATLMEEFLSQIDQKIQALKVYQNNTLWLIIALAILLSLILSYFLARKITSPILELSAFIKDTVKEGFHPSSKKAPLVSGSSDEIGELTGHFNHMLGEIQARMQENLEKNEELALQNEELSAINTQIQESENRLSRLNHVKDRILAIISHDLRSPLATVKGFMHIIDDNAEAFTSKEIQNFARQNQKSLFRVIDLLDNLLQWSLSQTGELDFKPQGLDPSEVIRTNIDLYEKSASNKQITLHAKVISEAQVYADPNMLDYILRNLIANAIKFSHPNSEIWIKAQEAEEDWINFSVMDEGVGIGKEEISKILFEGEHHTSRGTGNEKGTGFGLLLVKSFIEKHGGTLKFESEEGKGTTVNFRLQKMSVPELK